MSFDNIKSPDLCEVCGGVPIDEKTVLQTPKYWYRKYGDCSCNDNRNADPMESPSEGFAMDYRHEIHDYLVEKGEREE